MGSFSGDEFASPPYAAWKQMCEDKGMGWKEGCCKGKDKGWMEWKATCKDKKAWMEWKAMCKDKGNVSFSSDELAIPPHAAWKHVCKEKGAEIYEELNDEQCLV